jgi:mannitol/fructose-specific phosphotransferase system IIA component (Ntr-type)
MIRQSDSVSLSSILGPENIVFLQGPPSREEAIRQLVDRIIPAVAGVVSPDALRARLSEVEKLNRVLESGFYIPHAKFPELAGFHAVLGLYKDGFHDTASGLTVKAVLLLLSPHKPAYFQKHLNVLSLLSQTFQPELIEKMSVLDDAAAVCAFFSKK